MINSPYELLINTFYCEVFPTQESKRLGLRPAPHCVPRISGLQSPSMDITKRKGKQRAQKVLGQCLEVSVPFFCGFPFGGANSGQALTSTLLIV